MAEKQKAQTEKPDLQKLLKQYGDIEDPRERAKFYQANPALAEVISPGNHHV